MPDGYTEAAALAYREQAEEGRRAGRMITMAIVDADSGALLGSCDMRYPDPEDPGLGEIGYLLAPDTRGRGAATRAIGMLVGWGFRELGMRRIQALVHPDNPASAAVLQRVGFQREGLLRRYLDIDGDWRDHISYALLAEDLPGGVVERWRSRVPR
jgi:ribosomal-protein-alanine N-acetyltransferase